jgi:subtilisin family serine protease
MCDALLGLGQIIYIMDDGFNIAHPDLKAENGRMVDTYVVPNQLTPANEQNFEWAPEDITDYNGRGTSVASVAAGIQRGVASRADLVLIKYKNAAKSYNNEWKLRQATLFAVQDASQYMIEEIRTRRSNGYSGKAIINFSGGMLT